MVCVCRFLRKNYADYTAFLREIRVIRVEGLFDGVLTAVFAGWHDSRLRSLVC